MSNPRTEAWMNKNGLPERTRILDFVFQLEDELSAANAEIERIKLEHQNCTAYVGWQEALNLLDKERTEVARLTDEIVALKLLKSPSHIAAEKEVARLRQEVEELKAGQENWFNSVPYSKLCKVWDRVIGRVPDISRHIYLGALDELAEHLGIKKPYEFNQDEFIVMARIERDTLAARVSELERDRERLVSVLKECLPMLEHFGWTSAERSDVINKAGRLIPVVRSAIDVAADAAKDQA